MTKMTLFQKSGTAPVRAYSSIFRLLLAFSCLLAAVFADAQTTSGRVGFSISFRDTTSNLKVITAMIMPGATLEISGGQTASASKGNLSRSKSGWAWKAPESPGLAQIEFSSDQDTILLNLLVLTPFRNGEQTELNGYKVGAYSRTLFKGLSTYAPPLGFVELTEDVIDLKVSPNFTLRQFICKQQPGFDPSYLLIRTSLLVKLETLLEAANAQGWEADTLTVMSGFRTPYYNAQIGNTTTSSRHLYGGAADVYIDQDGDGQMDDLNGDGKINKDDASALATLANSLSEKGGANWPPGGIGIYAANAAHGPFVHIDARGYKARW